LPLDGERVALAPVLDRLAELEMNEVLVEAGAILAGELLRQALVDELLLYVGLRLLGPSARALVTMPPLARLADAPSFSLFDMQPVGDDLRLRLRPGGTAPAPR
jgi:diaminohydroxyphosphoribosylaminopyrimidine deaminase/5-amino-6-(5-phosphoribosylamino)uracil reductase